jgi:Putative lumazine-binding
MAAAAWNQFLLRRGVGYHVPMKTTFASALTGGVLLAACGGHQDPGGAPAGGEREAIAACVRRYFAAVDRSNSAELKRAFHPATMMFWRGDDGSVAGLSQADWAKRLDAGPPLGPADRREIVRIDVEGEAAAAVTVSTYPTFAFEDFLLLLRVRGRWQIVAKVFHRRQGASPAAAPAGNAREAIAEVLARKFRSMDTNDGAVLGSAYHPRAMTFALAEQELVAVSIAEWQARFDERRAAGPAPRAERRIGRIDVAGDVGLAAFEHLTTDARVVDLGLLVRDAAGWRLIALVYTVQEMAPVDP